ncbi:hypothetical protein QTP88_013896 [Uroleucon formosanum]
MRKNCLNHLWQYKEEKDEGNGRRSPSSGGTLAEYNRTWDQWLMGRFVLEKPALVRRTMGTPRSYWVKDGKRVMMAAGTKHE